MSEASGVDSASASEPGDNGVRGRSPREIRRDIDLHVVRMGDGQPPLVLVHGFTGSSLDWFEAMPALAERREVIAPDHRGHGDSPNTGDFASYNVQQLATDFAQLVDRLGLTSFHLLGHSMGGVVVQLFTLAHPERVRSLVLMDTMATPSLRFSMDLIDKVTAKARDGGMHAVMAKMIENSRNLAPVPIRDVVLANMATKLGQMDPEAYGGLAHSLVEFEPLVDRLGAIRCPVTVLVGELDQPFRAPSEAMAKAIPGSRLIVIEGTGHCPQEDKLDVWLDEIEQHLAWADASIASTSG